MHVDQQSAVKGESEAVELPASVWDEISLAYEWTTRALGYLHSGGPWADDMGDDPMAVSYEIESLCGRLRLAGCDVPAMALAEIDPLSFLESAQGFLSALVVRN